MSKICNSETHDQDSPNLQNLLCNYKSVTEIIQAKNGVTGKDFHPPTFEYLLNAGETEIVIIQDISQTMTPRRYGVIRLGLEHLFISLKSRPQNMSVIYANADTAEAKFFRNDTSLGNHFWPNVFPEELPTFGRYPLNLEKAFEFVKTQVCIAREANIFIHYVILYNCTNCMFSF